MAKGCGENSTELWYYGKGNITAVNIINNDNRGTYALGEAVNLTAVQGGVGRGAAFKVHLRPKTSSGTPPTQSEFDRADILGGGLNYGTQLVVESQGASTNIVTTTSTIPILGGSNESATEHAELSFDVNTSPMWHQALTFDGGNSIISAEIEYAFNSITTASVTLMNRPSDISSLFSNYDASGQYTDFFHEGQEILLRDHTTHLILFRGTIQELEDTFEMGFGHVVLLQAADGIKEWDDIPAEVFNATTPEVKIPSAKFYSIIENKLGPYETIGGGERRIAFGEGPNYRLNSVPAGAVFPVDVPVYSAKEGKIAAKRGYGHQVGRRFAFENSWFPRDVEHFSENNLTVGETELNATERALVGSTTFNKGKQKVLTALQNLAAQEPHGEYRRTDGEYINLDGTESEWAFHLSPNILSPVPEILGTAVATDGKRTSWITSNLRTFLAADISYAGAGFLTIASAAGGIGFYPSDVGKKVSQVGGAQSIEVKNVSSDHKTLYTDTGTTWVTNATATLTEGVHSIPQFNYFEVGSRPAFSFGSNNLSNFAVSEQDVRKYSVTLMAPREAVSEQGIRVGRATTSEQSGDQITQPSKVGSSAAVKATTKIKDDTAYSLKSPLHWEVQVGSVADETSTTKLRYRYVFAGTEITNQAWIDGELATPAAAGSISNYTHATNFFDLRFNVQIRFDTSGTHVAGNTYSFFTYPQFDNTRAIKLTGRNATFSKYNHEKYSNALVYYDAEAASSESYGSSARIQAELIYGWGVQNRSWILSTSANAQKNSNDAKNYLVKVHHGDAVLPHAVTSLAGGLDECINFSANTTPRTSVDDFENADGDAFERPVFNPGDALSGLIGSFDRNDSKWNNTEDVNNDDVRSGKLHPFRDFYWRNKQLTEGEFKLFTANDVGGASRGGRASEYLDLYRGRYSTSELTNGGTVNDDTDAYQIEWRRWKSGENIAAVQYVSVPAGYDTSKTPLTDNASGAGVHPPSGGGSEQFPFGVGDDETAMVHMLISFERNKTTGQSIDSGGKGTWPTTNTYDESGKPQIDAFRDFPFVRLVGKTTGTKFDFDAEIGKRPEREAWGGRPIDTWKNLRPLRRVYQKDNVKDEIRVDLATALHRRTSDMRVGKFRSPLAPYYWLEAQVDGFTKTGGQEYGDDNIDPSTATTNPNSTKTIRFKLQHIGAPNGTKYYNPLQYGLMIGNTVRFYNHEVGTGGANTVQNFEDEAEFCYGVITDIQSITLSPQYYTGTASQSGTVVTGSSSPVATAWTADMVGGTFRWDGYPSSGEITGHTDGDTMAVTNPRTVPSGTKYVINKHNEDTFDMCGWIEVELTHVYRKAGTEAASVTATNRDGTNSSSNNKVTYKNVVATSGATYSEPNLAAIDGGSVGSNSGRDSIYKDGDAQTNPTYAGPTRVKVYNMLYPGYSIFAEDVANGISAKHVIEGMRFSNRQGVIETEYHTSGKKTDHLIKKWGTTPVHLRTSAKHALKEALSREEQRNSSGVANNSLNTYEGLSSATDYWFNNLGGSPDEIISGWDGIGDFER